MHFPARAPWMDPEPTPSARPAPSPVPVHTARAERCAWLLAHSNKRQLYTLFIFLFRYRLDILKLKLHRQNEFKQRKTRASNGEPPSPEFPSFRRTPVLVGDFSSALTRVVPVKHAAKSELLQAICTVGIKRRAAIVTHFQRRNRWCFSLHISHLQRSPFANPPGKAMMLGSIGRHRQVLGFGPESLLISKMYCPRTLIPFI